MFVSSNHMTQMEEEAWEALDVDDSDLPSLLLRPCKRHHNNTPSHQHSHLSCSQSTPTALSSQTLQSPPHSQLEHTPPPPPPPPPSSPSSTSRRLIPGPAGAVQSAMLLKASRANHNDDSPIPTQEYIRRAVEDGEEDHDDDDFKHNPWLCALEFLGRQGMVDGELPSTPLSSIKKCLNIGRVNQVVAVIKSCTPNGLGDMMVTLKDPTGTINASIHQKVLAEVEYGKELSVGSVLILQKVAVFAPSRSAHYLNITLSNVVKVISKDSGPPLKQNYPVSAIKPVVLGIEFSRETSNMHNAFSLELDRTEGNLDNIRQYANVRDTAHNNKQMEQGNPHPQSRHCSSTSRRDQNDTVGKEPLLARHDAAKEIVKKTVRTDTIDNEQGGFDDTNKLQRGGYSSHKLQQSSAAANLVNDQEIWGTGIQKQRQPLISRASLPEWTDEQLNELFVPDCEDGGSLF